MEYPGNTAHIEQRDIVITAGGTREQIDDVRFVSNFSGGALGHALAEEFASYDRNVLLLAPRAVTDRYGEIEGVEHRTFSSCADLDEKLKSIKSARVVMQAAAVADYSPVISEGKISSNEDELVIRMRRNPKILASLREHFGKHTYIVGFKLLSGVSSGELLETARNQIAANRTDMCVANDLKSIHPRTRTVYAVPRGQYPSLRINGSTREVARHLSSQVLLMSAAREGVNHG